MIHIITGEIGSGKTTYLIKNIIEPNKHLIFNGYLTERIYFDENNKSRHNTVGFSFKTFTGKTIPFAHKTEKIGNIFIKDYWISEESFIKVVDEMNSINNYDVLIIDELGIFEQNFKNFINNIKNLVTHSQKAYLIIQQRALEKWISYLSCDKYEIITIIGYFSR